MLKYSTTSVKRKILKHMIQNPTITYYIIASFSSGILLIYEWLTILFVLPALGTDKNPMDRFFSIFPFILSLSRTKGFTLGHILHMLHWITKLGSFMHQFNLQLSRLWGHGSHSKIKGLIPLYLLHICLQRIDAGRAWWVGCETAISVYFTWSRPFRIDPRRWWLASTLCSHPCS